jgi:hypothetical protein
MNRMLVRVVLVMLLWISAVVGAAHLFGDVGARAGIAGGVFVLALLTVLHLRRRRRLRVWNTTGESLFPPGPRRVLLRDTGLG